ncbi:hypothetical protein DENIS_4687 [Desulfonema ishimotonii]|uniref:Periplasmic heavy metal sensor n=1 Tax=Desulfonema ishimotonii TaxID=45657 RepID=A0A401G370_9BACT|nr:Spy/CpxP family protein refolding chaperone [Desulfonema ishimotonii]GBC63689.1 hypothetical protein DENIS_4687 [Desulfonema ishimotonii]
MKQNRALTILMALAMILAGTATAMAGHGRGHRGDMGFGGHGHGFIGKNFVRALDLSDEQKAAVGTILKANLDTIKTRMDAVMAARENMAGVIHGDSPTEEAVRAAFSQVASAREELVVLRFTMMNQIRTDVLTPEQIEKMAARQARRAERTGKMKERHAEKWAEFVEWVDSLIPSDTGESDTSE